MKIKTEETLFRKPLTYTADYIQNPSNWYYDVYERHTQRKNMNLIYRIEVKAQLTYWITTCYRNIDVIEFLIPRTCWESIG